MKSEMVVIVDSREQKPYRFPRYEVKMLPTGDYSIFGLEDKITIERKSHKDAFSSVGNRRDRFRRELERMSDFDYAAIVVEADIKTFLETPAFSRMQPKPALNTLIAWSVKYGVHLFFAGDRLYGNALTLRLLEKFRHYNHEGIDGE